MVEVNGINVEGKTPNDVLMILKMAENTITFKLIPNETKVSPRESRDDTDRETHTLFCWVEFHMIGIVVGMFMYSVTQQVIG